MNTKVEILIGEGFKLPGSGLDITGEFADHAMGILDRSFYYSTPEKIKEEFNYFTDSIISRLGLPENSKIYEALVKIKGECLFNLTEVDTDVLDSKHANLYECFHLFIEAAFYANVYPYDINSLEREFLLGTYTEPTRKNVLGYFVSLLKREEFRKPSAAVTKIVISGI